MKDISQKLQESCNNLAKTYAYNFDLLKIQCIACQAAVQILAADLINSKLLKSEDFIEFAKKEQDLKIRLQIGIKQKLKNQNKMKANKEHAKKLQEILVQTCIDFCKENNITDTEEVDFHVDCLQVSILHGEWGVESDSSIALIPYKEDEDGLKYRDLDNSINYF